MEGIQVSIDKVDLSPDTFLIRVGGYVDTTTSQELDRTLEDLLKKDVNRIVIDLENVDYISSAGWGIFISEIKAIRKKGGDIKLVKMTPDVFEVFELLEFDHILRSYDSVEDAVADFEAGEVAGGEGEVLPETAGDADPGTEHTETPARAERDEPATLSLDDRVRRIVRGNPEFRLGEIRDALRTERHGGLDIGLVRTWLTLKRLNLHTMRKRIVYARASRS
jgi:anti-sigma B factor antagonist